MSVLFVVEVQQAKDLWSPVIDVLGVVLTSEQLSTADKWMREMMSENPGDKYRVSRFERKNR